MRLVIPLAALAGLAVATARGGAPQDALWWSLAPLVAPDVPRVPPGGRNAVDAFVAAALEGHGLTPSPEADRRTLLRRVTFDLIGLPPTPEELDAFLADDAPGAYERVVERLLSSPRHGERWARHWLDVAHYGDTHGYDKDKRRPNAWPYRDWVVRALNDDMPYGAFVEQQLAGDVLAPDAAEGVIATGFIVAGPWDFVGHVELREGTLDKEIAQNLDRDDMVTNAMTSFASTTAHCARCHDHKFDPIPQADYYALQAVFAGVERAERPIDLDPATARRRRELARTIEAGAAERAALRARVAAIPLPESDARLARIEAQLAPDPGAAPVARTLGYHSAIAADPGVVKWVQVDLGARREIERVVLVGAHEAYGGHPGPGFGFVPRFRVEASDDPQFAAATVLVDHASADYPHPGDRPVDVPLAAPVSARYVRVTATRLFERTDDFIFALGELAVFAGGANVARGAPVTALDTIEAGEAWGARLLVDGVFGRTSFAELARADEGDPWAALARRAALADEAAALRDARPARQLALADDATRAALAAAEDALEAAEAELAALPAPAHVYAAAPTPGGAPRAIHVLVRGREDAPGAPVEPGALSALAQVPARFAGAEDDGARRLAFARWLSDPRNPLTWRSIANRVWHYHFGRGLVATPNDFGRMGERPTHPALLDWLALSLRDGGQSLKDLHRVIVTSATYRQSSADRADQALLDADNRYLWRMNRRRLEAEALRDSLLAVSGCLDLTPGGPGYDLFAFEDDHSPRYLYEQHDVDDPRTWRRSIYRTVVRSVPDPLMETFDCADPSLNVPARDETNTPLQALALLNDRFVLSQARYLAQRLAPVGNSAEERIDTAYRLALGRAATARERAALARHARRFGLPAACRVLFNLSELAFVD
jgi:hypothetical protein